MNNCYIFFANTITGISGGPLYVKNKKNYLKSKSWKVVVFDGYSDVRDIEIFDFKEYENNRIPALSFPPSWFTESGRAKVLREIQKRLPKANSYVIETNQLYLAEWGELLAKQLNCQHIYYHINELDILEDQDVFEFLYYKISNNDLFAINSKVCLNLFSKFKVITNPQDYVWDARCHNVVEDVSIDKLINIPNADYTIGFFGRYKPFIPSMLEEINKFCINNPKVKVNLCVMGLKCFPQDTINILSADNIKVIFVGEQSPIPLRFFSISDVIIATAGCATISYKQGNIVIPINVETHKPLGIYGISTFSSTFQIEGDYVETESLSTILQKVYEDPQIVNSIIKYSITEDDAYKRHLQFLKNTNRYYDIRLIEHRNNHYLQRLFVKMGLCDLLLLIKRIKYRICG